MSLKCHTIIGGVILKRINSTISVTFLSVATFISLILLPFDFILYPLMLLYYNQWTLNSKPTGVFLTLFRKKSPSSSV
ncbi:hypothetical protein BTR23_18355 [Alkalihalophilus pseudofirmus]|nr:hypothetical protein BTR23_18355 [Alkalihalophilus pseudofirmus]